MSPRARPFWLFLLLLLLFPATSVLVQWLSGEKDSLAWWELALLAAFPLLAWVWLRHFSVLGCREGCRPPKE